MPFSETLLMVFRDSQLVGAIVGFLLSWVVDFFPAFSTAPSKIKNLIVFLLCLVVPFAAYGISIASGLILYDLDTLGAAFTVGLAAYVASQANYTIFKMENRRG
jgi:NhaP-type Na+/H+ or K+/H+ antiporter